jgi:hypothetical protein
MQKTGATSSAIGPKLLPISAKSADATRELARSYLCLLDTGCNTDNLIFTATQRCAELGQRAIVAGTELAQPANFLIQIGLGAVLKARGVEPADCIGHSLGSRTQPRETIPLTGWRIYAGWMSECPKGEPSYGPPLNAYRMMLCADRIKPLSIQCIVSVLTVL